MEVLILVLVEDGLGENRNFNKTPAFLVLILVLVEDGLGAICILQSSASQQVVLILVLVEDGLGVQSRPVDVGKIAKTS